MLVEVIYMAEEKKSLFQEIMAYNMEAYKAHDQEAKDACGALISAARNAQVVCKSQNKPFTDAEMGKVVTKTLKELEEELDVYVKGNRPERAEAIKKQIEVVNKFKPQLMSEDEIRKIIEALPDKSIKSVMKEFKTNYPGKADMSMVSKIAMSFQGK
jgi:uncharacterized protein YqeY